MHLLPSSLTKTSLIRYTAKVRKDIVMSALSEDGNSTWPRASAERAQRRRRAALPPGPESSGKSDSMRSSDEKVSVYYFY